MAQLPIDLEITINPNLCASCGRCCSFRPGRSLPSDWGETDDEIARRLRIALENGNYTNDPWEGDPRPGMDEHGQVAQIRPAGRDYVGQLMHAPYWEEVPCVFLGEAGCTLAFAERPYQCRALMPGMNTETGERNCETIGMSARDLAIAWVPYQPMLRMIMNDIDVCRNE